MIGYRAKRYCCEDISLIENYDKAVADKTQTWDVHHRAEILPCGRYTSEDLKKHGLYWNRPADELVFMTRETHLRLHSTDKKFSYETRVRMSVKLKGKPSWNKGKVGVYSEETLLKMSRARDGIVFSPEHRQKLSSSHKGTHWWNNGIVEVHQKECPEGFRRGRLMRN